MSYLFPRETQIPPQYSPFHICVTFYKKGYFLPKIKAGKNVPIVTQFSRKNLKTPLFGTPIFDKKVCYKSHLAQ